MFTYVKQRWLLILIIAAIGLALGAVFGRSVLAICISIVGVSIVFMVMEKWKSPSSGTSDQPARLDAEPFSFIFRWELKGNPDLVAISDTLGSLGFKQESATSSNADLVMVGGSQVWTRLFGGYFVPLEKLPLRAELSVVPQASAIWELQLNVSDRFGWAIRDSSRERRPKIAAMRIKDAVEGCVIKSGDGCREGGNRETAL